MYSGYTPFQPITLPLADGVEQATLTVLMTESPVGQFALSKAAVLLCSLCAIFSPFPVYFFNLFSIILIILFCCFQRNVKD